MATPVRATLPAMLALLRLQARVSRPLSAAVVAGAVLNGLLGPATVLATGAVAGAVFAGQGVVLAVVLLGAAFAAQRLLEPIQSELATALTERVQESLDDRLTAVLADPPGLAHLEDPAVLNGVARAQGAVTGSSPARATGALAGTIGSRLRAGLSLAIVGAWHWWALLPLIAAYSVSYAASRWHWHQVTQVIYGRTEALRRSYYLRGLALGARAAKETRVFGLAGWLVDRYRDSWLAVMREVWGKRRPQPGRRRGERRGQDHLRQAAGPAPRSAIGAHHRRRRRPSPAGAARLATPGGRGVPGLHPLRAVRPRQRGLRRHRAAGRSARRRARLRARRRGRGDRPPPRRLGHPSQPRARGRGRAVRGRMAAPGPGPGSPRRRGRCRSAGARRAHRLARRARRSGGLRALPRAHPGRDHHRHLPPLLHRPPRRPHRGAGGGAGGRRSLRDVSFTYPGTERPILDKVDLFLPAGSTVAIVGSNGAGKTTLVKLLCRFYEPTSGAILLDDLALRDVPVAEWRARIASGFQDFARLSLLAREAVGVGDVPRIDTDAVVLGAFERAAAAEVPGALRRGLDTQLGRDFEGGVDLSHGQWQKLALARAMMRPTPLLLVLDEPTASLDAATEHALFERFAGAARAGAAQSAITVLVSHRFSTVRMADLILVIDGCRIAEAGDHAALMRAGGLYAELYQLQARGYR